MSGLVIEEHRISLPGETWTAFAGCFWVIIRLHCEALTDQVLQHLPESERRV